MTRLRLYYRYVSEELKKLFLTCRTHRVYTFYLYLLRPMHCSVYKESFPFEETQQEKAFLTSIRYNANPHYFKTIKLLYNNNFYVHVMIYNNGSGHQTHLLYIHKHTMSVYGYHSPFITSFRCKDEVRAREKKLFSSKFRP